MLIAALCKRCTQIAVAQTTSQKKSTLRKISYQRKNNFAEGEKLNIGSGIRNWTNWLCYDELDATGVTKVKFNEKNKLPKAVNKKLAVEFIFYSIQYIFKSTSIEKIYGLEDINNKNAFTINQLFGFYDKQQNYIKEINGLNYRYGELTNYDFKSVAKNPKVDFLIKYSKTIIL